MDTSTIVWIVVVVVIVLILVAVIGMAMNKKKEERDRTQAGELREQATAQTSGVEQREAVARETEAKAAQSRAEADRLDAEAQDKHTAAAEHRDERDESLRQADVLDPDTDNSDEDPVESSTGGADADDTTTHRG